jgi:hypothetical protein
VAVEWGLAMSIRFEESDAYPNHVWDNVEKCWKRKQPNGHARETFGPFEGAQGERFFGNGAPFEGFVGSQGEHFPKNEWPKPKPLPVGLSRVASFNSAFLPESIAPWVMDIADRMQWPA